MLLLLSSAEALRARYGDGGSADLVRAFEALASELAEAYGGAVLVLPDDRNSMGRHRLPSFETSSVAGVRAALDRLWERLAPDALLILGGDGVVPFLRVPNPTCGIADDRDEQILTDNVYGQPPGSGTRGEELLTPTAPVGRIPDPEPPDPAAWLRILASVATPRRGGGRGVLAVVNRAWEAETRRLLAGTQATVHLVPDWNGAIGPWPPERAALLYFKLHGFTEHPRWQGENPLTRRFVDGLAPADVTPEAVKGAVILAQNCYGALSSGRSPGTSVSLAALAAGARAFIGSTGFAWGSILGASRLVLDNADALADRCLDRLLAGAPFGSALQESREHFVECNPENPYGRKTALEFVLYGDPLASLQEGETP